LAENLTQDLGCHVVGVDVIPEFVQYCQENKQAFGEFHWGDFGHMELPSDWRGAFDVVAALEVIEHALDVRAFRDRVLWVLAPGGRLVVTTPHPRGLMGYGSPLESKAHWRMWTPGRLTAYANIHRDECGRLLSMGAVFVRGSMMGVSQ
jgi:2-polyprenyl-3-methyl-5-hydroxy-6-metoxy-1,4-benzoquinol methylase